MNGAAERERIICITVRTVAREVNGLHLTCYTSVGVAVLAAMGT